MPWERHMPQSPVIYKYTYAKNIFIYIYIKYLQCCFPKLSIPLSPPLKRHIWYSIPWEGILLAEESPHFNTTLCAGVGTEPGAQKTLNKCKLFLLLFASFLKCQVEICAWKERILAFQALHKGHPINLGLSLHYRSVTPHRTRETNFLLKIFLRVIH